MNLLIVDDEYYSVEGLRQTIAGSSLAFDEIFCAYSMEDAQEIFRCHPVDILLSDIEMPRGSGLDLLEWVRQQGFQTVGIFLTSFATFDYASRALRLQSEDYLLKPAGEQELLGAVQKAMEKVERTRSEKLHAEYWDRIQGHNLGEFWKSIATGAADPPDQIIRHELAVRHLPPETAESVWLPALLECRETVESAAWEKPLYNYAIRNILVETLFTDEEDPVVPEIGENQFLLLCRPQEGCPISDWINSLERMVEKLTSVLPGIFHVFPEETPCGAKELASVCTRLKSISQNVIYRKSRVFAFENANAMRPIPSPPWERWSEMLLSKKGSRVQQEALDWIDALRDYPQASRRELTAFHGRFLQMFYDLLKRMGQQAYESFAANETVLTNDADTSVDRLQNWIVSVFSAADACVSEAVYSSTVIDTVKAYIEEHLSEELPRNLLAAAVYLSPDYLSHLFAEREHVSLTDYIITRRIHRAKELLLERDVRIRDVALKSGFQSISYFSKQFKKSTGFTPQEFRKTQLK